MPEQAGAPRSNEDFDEEYLSAMRRLHNELKETQEDSRSSREERSLSELLAKKVALKLKKKAAILEAKKNFKLEKAALLMSKVQGWSTPAAQPEMWAEPKPVQAESWAPQQSTIVMTQPSSTVEYVEMCQKVPKPVCEEKPQKVCKMVKEEKCIDVPREQCRQVPDQLCTDEPREVCEDKEFCKEVPKQNCEVKEQQKCTPFPTRKCTKVPKEQCRTYPREVCTEVVSRKCSVVPDKVCKKMTVKRPREVCLPSSSSTSSSWASDSASPFKDNLGATLTSSTGVDPPQSSIFSNFGKYF